MNKIPHLPEDIRYEILLKGDYYTIKTYCLTSKSEMKLICNNNKFWEKHVATFLAKDRQKIFDNAVKTGKNEYIKQLIKYNITININAIKYIVINNWTDIIKDLIDNKKIGLHESIIQIVLDIGSANIIELITKYVNIQYNFKSSKEFIKILKIAVENNNINLTKYLLNMINKGLVYRINNFIILSSELNELFNEVVINNYYEICKIFILFDKNIIKNGNLIVTIEKDNSEIFNLLINNIEYKYILLSLFYKSIELKRISILKLLIKLKENKNIPIYLEKLIIDDLNIFKLLNQHGLINLYKYNNEYLYEGNKDIIQYILKITPENNTFILRDMLIENNYNNNIIYLFETQTIKDEIKKWTKIIKNNELPTATAFISGIIYHDVTVVNIKNKLVQNKIKTTLRYLLTHIYNDNTGKMLEYFFPYLEDKINLNKLNVEDTKLAEILIINKKSNKLMTFLEKNPNVNINYLFNYGCLNNSINCVKKIIINYEINIYQQMVNKEPYYIYICKRKNNIKLLKILEKIIK